MYRAGSPVKLASSVHTSAFPRTAINLSLVPLNYIALFGHPEDMNTVPYSLK
jgi:hypothetical protein